MRLKFWRKPKRVVRAEAPRVDRIIVDHDDGSTDIIETTSFGSRSSAQIRERRNGHIAVVHLGAMQEYFAECSCGWRWDGTPTTYTAASQAMSLHLAEAK